MNLTHLFLLLLLSISVSVCHAQLSNDTYDLTTSIIELPSSSNSISPRELILTAKDDKILAVLRRYHFQLRSTCPFDLNQYLSPSNKPLPLSEHSLHCPTTADYLHCFPTTPANHETRFECPFSPDILSPTPDVFARRNCYSNGTWAPSNYTLCMQAITNFVNSGASNINRMMATFYVVGFSMTIVCVSVAIGIFVSFRSLRCLRNMIHSNMLATFLLKCSTYIAFYIFVVNKDDPIAKQNNVMCVIFNIFWNYSLLTSFFWNMIEAVYLITVIVAAYSSNKIKLWWYLIIGWVLPIVPIIPYSILTFKSTNTSCSWIQSSYNSQIDMLIDIPIYIVLLINFILLFIILYVIINKLRVHNDTVKPKYVQYKKLIRATVVLFPLFGLTFAVFFWLPPDNKTLFAKIYYGINIFLQTTQGIWVCFVYCYLNDEVNNALRSKFRSWKNSYLGAGMFRPNRGTSHTTQATCTTTTTHTTTIKQRPRDCDGPSDPACMPMLPLAEQPDVLTEHA